MEPLLFVTRGFLFSVMGIILGLCIDCIFYKLYESSTKTKNKTLAMIALQILVNVVIMYYYIRFKRTNNGIMEHWQFSLLALSFPAFFFNVQFHMFKRLQEMFSWCQ